MSDTAIKVLILEDDHQIATLVEAMLDKTAARTFEVTHVVTLAAAVQQLTAGNFDVVVADLTVPDSDGLHTFMTLHQTAPSVPVVVLTGHEDLDLETSILQAGAQDYLVKSHLNHHVLGKTLRCAVQRHQVRSSKMGRLIGFVGAKGGVGTTTVAVNLAHILTRQGKNVIAAEMKPYLGSFSIEFGHEPEQDLGGLLALNSSLITPEELGKRLFNSPSGVRVLFSPQQAGQVKRMQSSQAEAILLGLAHMADYTIVDLPAHPSRATRTAARLCNCLCLVLEREMASVLAAKRTLEYLKAAGANELRIGAVIVSHIPLEMPMDLREIRDRLGCPIVGVVPPAAEAMHRARHLGTPLVFAAPESTVSYALTELAERLASGTIIGLKL